MVPSDQVFLALGHHELKLLAAALLAEWVYEQVKVVDLGDLFHKFVDMSKELLRIHIVDQVNVNFVLS